MSVLRHLSSILLLPFTMTVVIPALLVRGAGGVRPGWALAQPGQTLAIAAGAVLVAIGVALLARTIALFATRGRGTLAPWDPPRRLVVEGVYRHVRNPMISGVIAIVLGETAILGLRPVAWLAAIFIAINATYIPLFEEPQLARRFGADYETYRRNVPRWVPRLRPWAGEE